VWLVLCSADDRSGLWAATELRARGLDPLVVLTPDRLHYSFRWQHHIASGQPIVTRFALADGCMVDARELRGVLNRIAMLPPHLVNNLPPGERRHALNEWTALHVSWLSALTVPTLNLPVGNELCGAARHRSEWVWLASQAGFDIRPVSHSTATAAMVAGDAIRREVIEHVVIVDGKVMDDSLPKTMRLACERLAELSNTRLLGVDIDRATGTFVTASPSPDLQAGGADVVDALCSVLISG
jgi:hypothetical protein